MICQNVLEMIWVDVTSNLAHVVHVRYHIRVMIYDAETCSEMNI